MKKIVLLALIAVLFSSCGASVVATQPLPVTPAPVVEVIPEPVGLVTAVAYDCHIDSEGIAWSHVVLVNQHDRNVVRVKGFVDFTDSYGASARAFYDTKGLVITPNKTNTRGPYLTIVSVPFVGRKLRKCTAFLSSVTLASTTR